MKRILLDTNIIIDIALKREPHFEMSAKLFKLIDNKCIIGYITATTVTDIYYIARKEKGKVIALEFISNLIEVVEVLGIDKATIVKALKSRLKDFEDAVQLAAAEYNEVEIIVTRNKSDFLNCDTLVYTPTEFLEESR